MNTYVESQTKAIYSMGYGHPHYVGFSKQYWDDLKNSIIYKKRCKAKFLFEMFEREKIKSLLYIHT